MERNRPHHLNRFELQHYRPCTLCKITPSQLHVQLRCGPFHEVGNVLVGGEIHDRSGRESSLATVKKDPLIFARAGSFTFLYYPF